MHPRKARIKRLVKRLKEQEKASDTSVIEVIEDGIIIEEAEGIQPEVVAKASAKTKLVQGE